MTQIYIKEIRVAGIHTEYLERPGDGETLLVLHGWAHSKERWSNVFDQFATNFRIIVPDLPGFGNSDKPEVDYSLDFYSTFISSFCRAVDLSIGNMNVLAHSLGGSIALKSHLASAAKRTVLVDVPIVPIWPAHLANFFGKKFSSMYRQATRSNLIIKLFARLTVSGWRFVDEQMVSDVRKMTPRSALCSLGALSRIDLVREFSNCLTNTLVMHGEKDIIVSARQYVPLDPQVKSRMKLFTLESVGHSPFIENPWLFWEKCREHLKP